MTDEQIIAALAVRETLPTVNAIICEFHCGYQQAKQCLEKAKEKHGGEKKVYTLEDF